MQDDKKNAINSPLNVRFLAKQMLQYAPAALVPASFALLTSAIFTRVFSTAEYGQYSLTVSMASLLAALCTQWLQQGITRYLPGERIDVLQRNLKRAAAWVLVMTAVSAFTIFIVIGVVLSRLVAGGWPALVWAAGGLTVVTAVFNPVLAVLQAEMRAVRLTAYQSASATLRFGLSLLIVFVCYRHPASLVWASTCGLALLLPFMWRDADMPSLSQLHTWTNALPSIRRLAAYGFPMMGWFISASLLDVGDRYILQYFRGSTEVGIYSANYGLVTGAVGLATAPILMAAHPFLMRAWAEGHREQAGRWLGFIVTSFSCAGVVLIGDVWLFASDAAQWLLGAQFREGYRVMPVVFAGLVVWQLGMYLHKPLEFTGKTKLMLYLGVISGVFNIVSNVIFVPLFGYAAAAYSTLAAYALYAVLVALVSRHILPWKIDRGQLAGTACLSLTAVAITTVVRHGVEGRFGYLSGLSVSVFLAVLTAVAVLVRLFKAFSGQR